VRVSQFWRPAILERQESLDQFWAQRKQLGAGRREAAARRRCEFEERRDAWRQHVLQNIRNNREKLDGALNALSRTRDRIKDIEDKLSETRSDKWRGIFSEWLAEARAKESDIEGSVERIRGWIDEDERKLNS
jgi:hypothetical protein